MNFRYELLAGDNSSERGRIRAASLAEARAELQSRGRIILALKEETVAGGLWDLLNRDMAAQAPLPIAVRAHLYGEWASLIQAGIPVADSVLAPESKTKSRRNVAVHQMRQALRRGAGFGDAMAGLAPAFPDREVAIAKAGEAAGALGSTLQRLANDLAEQIRTRDEVFKALAYPAFTVLAALVATVVLLLTIVPALELFFEARANALPFITTILIGASRLLRAYGHVLGLGCIIFATAVFVAVKLLPRFRTFIEDATLRIPLLGPALRAFETANFTRSLGLLAEQGMPIGTALGLSRDAFGRSGLRSNIDRARSLVLQGHSLTDAFRTSHCCPSDVVRLVEIGERTGRLSMMLRQSAMLQENFAKQRMAMLMRALGPTLTIAVGALVGFIAYSMMSTILAINTVVGV
jgi:general secretion pathway protein F